MKNIRLDTLFLTIAIVALCANTIRQHYTLTNMTQVSGRNHRAIELLQVQLMDRLIGINQHEKIDLLLSDPDSWFKPLRQSINSDERKVTLLKQVAFKSVDEQGVECFEIYCNPVDNEIEPYELFTLYFQGNQCTEIRRRALLPW